LYVYIDGFNFYYRVFKSGNRKHPPSARYKWLDFLKLSQRLEPTETIDWLGYFTAYVRPTPADPTQDARQRAYIEALKTISGIEVIAGNFIPVTRRGPKTGAPASASPISIDTFEEKGSDVNLACRLVWDGARGAFSKALVITNDSDLCEPIKIVTQDIGLPVAVYSPALKVNYALRCVATTAAPLDLKLLKYCLLPDQLVTPAGIPISKPAEWS
jgi:hypothetical protein